MSTCCVGNGCAVAACRLSGRVVANCWCMRGSVGAVQRECVGAAGGACASGSHPTEPGCWHNPSESSVCGGAECCLCVVLGWPPGCAALCRGCKHCSVCVCVYMLWVVLASAGLTETHMLLLLCVCVFFTHTLLPQTTLPEHCGGVLSHARVACTLSSAAQQPVWWDRTRPFCLLAQYYLLATTRFCFGHVCCTMRRL